MTSVKQRKGFRMSCDIGKAAEGLENEAPPHSSTLTSLHLCHSSFSSPSASSPTSQVILKPFCCFTYIIDTSPTSQFILQPFCCFIYTTAHSTTLLPLYPCHSSFYHPSAASPTSQVILKPFCCFTYITGTSHTSPGEPPMHSSSSSSPWHYSPWRTLASLQMSLQIFLFSALLLHIGE